MIVRVRGRDSLMEQKEFLCYVCDKPEKECTCLKYCALCHTDYSLRLTEDGQFYCADCREACDYKTQEQVYSSRQR